MSNVYLGIIAFGLILFACNVEERQQVHAVQRAAGAIAIPDELARAVYQESEAAGIPLPIAIRLIKAESGFDSLAKNPSGATGLTQITLRTARELDSTVTAEDLLNARRNMALGFRYLAGLYREFDSWTWAVQAYRDGPAGFRACLSPSKYATVIVGDYK